MTAICAGAPELAAQSGTLDIRVDPAAAAPSLQLPAKSWEVNHVPLVLPSKWATALLNAVPGFVRFTAREVVDPYGVQQSRNGVTANSVAVGDVNGDQVPDVAVLGWCPARAVNPTDDEVLVLLVSGAKVPVAYVLSRQPGSSSGDLTLKHFTYQHVTFNSRGIERPWVRFADPDLKSGGWEWRIAAAGGRPVRRKVRAAYRE